MSRLPVCVVAAALLAVATPAAAGPLDPWGAHVGDGVFALTPFLYAYQGTELDPIVYGQYGVTDKLELLGGVGAGLDFGGYAAPDSFAFSLNDVELMPRYFFSDTTGVALHLTWGGPGDAGVTIAPELHGVYETGPITTTLNVGYGPYVGKGGFSAGSVYALIGPEHFFNDATSVFLEVNPAFDIPSKSFALDVVPGVSTSIAETHYFSFGVGIPVVGFDPSGIWAGMWYSISFGGA
jgi:hypothetical protein